MKRVRVHPDFADWRTHARAALQQGFLPEEISFDDATVQDTLELPLVAEDQPTGPPYLAPHTSKAFLDLAALVAVHRDPERWNLLYRVLYRLQTNRSLLQIEIDADVARLQQMQAQIRRDLHKMHAFVRFRKLAEDRMDEGSPFLPHADAIDPDHPSAATPETFVAWYRPDHRILRLAAPFFAERFAVMRWSILTPDESVAWDPRLRQFHWFEGLPRESAPAEDELESLWRSYYGSIFNPARLNTTAMRSEMPMRYWQNLPEIQMLPDLIQGSAARVETMVQIQAGKPSAAPFVPATHELPAINAALPSCKGCDLYLHATQAVPGQGPAPETTHHAATLMLIGEQPGDQEDRQGAPFVGPAGRVLDQALAELGIDRSETYVTNAVKHFKFVQRGKLRLHQNPKMGEITACRPWLLAEIDAVRPRVILCLGASAAKSLLGGTFGLMKDRGKVMATPYADHVIATIHPSAILRAQDDATRDQLYGYLKGDLDIARQHARSLGSSAQPTSSSL